MNTVYVFGDSVSKGIIIDGIKKKYTVLADNFAAILSPALGMNIKNFSHMGCTVTKGENILEKHLTVGLEKGYAVLEFGGNDCDYDWAAIAANPKAVHLPKTDIDVFYSVYADMIKQTREAGLTPVMFDLPPINAGKYFDWFSRDMDKTGKENILNWLGGSVEYIYRWHEMYNMQVMMLAQNEKVPVIDIRSEFLKMRDYADLLCCDGIHPNENGHKLIAEAVKKEMPRLTAALR